MDALIFSVDPPGAAAALGVFFIVFAVFAAFMLASALPKRALAAVLAVAVPRFLVAGVADLADSQALSRAGAALGFLLAAMALYTAPDGERPAHRRRCPGAAAGRGQVSH